MTSPTKKLIIVLGLSGAGKSTLGPNIAEYLGSAYLDEDQFFRPHKEMPVVDYPAKDRVLKSRQTKLWDHENSIDFAAMTKAINKKFKEHTLVVFTGFYVPPDILLGWGYVIDRFLIFDICPEVSLARRQHSKAVKSPGGKWDVKKDRWMMENYTWPFYQKGLKLVENSAKRLGYAIQHIPAEGNPSEVWSLVRHAFPRMGMAAKLAKVFPDNEFLMNWEVIERAKRVKGQEEIEVHVLVPSASFVDFERWVEVKGIKNEVTKLADFFLEESWYTVSLFLNKANLNSLMDLKSDIYAFEEADELSPARD